MKIKDKAYCFDDVLLIPQLSDVESRKTVSTVTSLGGMTLTSPIISANMASVTELEMAKAMANTGGLGILHRYAEHETIVEWVRELKKLGMYAVPSVGIGSNDLDFALSYAISGADAICVDVAHGHSVRAGDMVENLAGRGIKVIAGNIATYEAALYLLHRGAQILKVGIGPGSVCTTRIVTGHGYPQLSAIMEVAKIKDTVKGAGVGIIADGGIRNSGDIVKALAAGADAVMLGGLLGGTDETPGIKLPGKTGGYEKVFRGMASAAQQLTSKGFVSGVPEGIQVFMKEKGPVTPIVEDLLAGLRSGCSYSGAKDLYELRQNAEFVEISSNTLKENVPHAAAFHSTT